MPRLPQLVDYPAVRRNAGPAAWWAAGTLVVSLTGIRFLMRNHKHGLRAEPEGEGPGPKTIEETSTV